MDVDIPGFSKVKRIMLILGKTDLRRGAYGLASYIVNYCGMDPVQKGVLWLFCGSNHKKIKGLIYEPIGFLVFQQESLIGSFKWPKIEGTVMEVSADQFQRLMEGYTIVPAIGIPEVPEKDEGTDTGDWETVKVKFQ